MEHDPPIDISAELAALAAETSSDDSPTPEAHAGTPAALARLATAVNMPLSTEQLSPAAEVDRAAADAEEQLQAIGIAHIQKLIHMTNLRNGRSANRAFRLLAEGLQRLESRGQAVRLGFGYYCTPEYFEQYADEQSDELLALLDDGREYEEYQLYAQLYGERLDDAPNNAQNAQLVLTLRKLTSDDGPVRRRKVRRGKRPVTLYSRAAEPELPETNTDVPTTASTTTIDGKEVVIGGGPPEIDLPASPPKFGRGEKLPGRVSDLNHRTIRKGGQHA